MYLLIYLLTYLLTYLIIYLPTYLLIYLLTFLLTSYLLTAISFSLGGSSPYTSTDKINKNICIYINETILKHSTNYTKHSKYK